MERKYEFTKVNPDDLVFRVESEATLDSCGV